MTTEADGILDTNTVILLSELIDDSGLPSRPTITTVTLAELSVGPLVASPMQRGRQDLPMYSKPRATSIRFRLMQRPLEYSDG